MITPHRLHQIEKYLRMVADNEDKAVECACEIIIDLLSERRRFWDVHKAAKVLYERFCNDNLTDGILEEYELAVDALENS